jgi:hypothetical protein
MGWTKEEMCCEVYERDATTHIRLMYEDREKYLSRLYRGNMMSTQKQDVDLSLYI